MQKQEKINWKNELWKQREFGLEPLTTTTQPGQEYLAQDLEIVCCLKEEAERFETKRYNHQKARTNTISTRRNRKKTKLSEKTQQVNPNNLRQLLIMDTQQLTQLITAITAVVNNNR
ncbi:hypothetical protein Glove_229g132 [Diversispora epigaea]|uniref:Uncharacterized protein n=1 Tax=Diversispora epigaea TaxID=1348612 RepID=A0A397IJ36_9GLOM|nr:hypothetical protein Glove_229g132 [Diversispora epigaea]